jgi:hypothetical protein
MFFGSPWAAANAQQKAAGAAVAAKRGDTSKSLKAHPNR